MIFYVEDAKKYGVEEAVLLANLRFWCEKNLANQRNLHECCDGKVRPWTYNSVQAWGKLFPYWSDSKIRRLLDKLYESGAVDKGNFNKHSYDRTLWYTVLSDEFICQDEQHHLSDSANGFAVGDEPIPDINTDTKPDVNTDPDGFAAAWEEYPNKTGKHQALTNYKKLLKYHTPDELVAAVRNYASEVKDRDKQYIKTGGNFFSGRQGFYADYLPGEYKPSDHVGPQKPPGQDIREWLKRREA